MDILDKDIAKPWRHNEMSHRARVLFETCVLNPTSFTAR